MERNPACPKDDEGIPLLTAQKLYEAIVRQRPHWLSDGPTLAPVGLKTLVLTCYNEGFKEGAAQGYAGGLGEPSVFGPGRKSPPAEVIMPVDKRENFFQDMIDLLKRGT